MNSIRHNARKRKIKWKQRLSVAFLSVALSLTAVPVAWADPDPGQILDWEAIIGETGSDIGYSIKATSDGGYIVGGQTLVPHVSNSHTDMALVKLNAAGEVSWSKSFGLVDNELSTPEQYRRGHDMANAVELTPDGGYILTGYGYYYSAYYEMYVVKTDADGNLQWEKHFGTDSQEDGRMVKNTPDGGYIVVGSTGLSTSDIYLVKLAANGDPEWEKTIDAVDDRRAYDLFVEADGYVIAGTQTTGADTNAFLLKTGLDGETVTWSYTYGGDGADSVQSLIRVSDGYVMTGQTKSASLSAQVEDVYLVKTDTGGVKVWEKALGRAQTDVGSSVKQDADGGYTIVGRTNSGSNGPNDVYMVKTDDEGDLLWDTTLGGPSFDHANDLIIAGDGYVLTGGTYATKMYVAKTKPYIPPAPPAPVIVAIADDTGRLSTDFVTNDTTWIVSGTAEADTTVTVYLNNASIGDTPVDGDGDWSLDYTATALTAGTHALSAEATNSGNVTGERSTAQLVELDLTKPNKPVIKKMDGMADDVRITKNNQIDLVGTAEAESLVTVYVDNVAVSPDTLKADSSGDWTYSHTVTADDAYTFTIDAEDTAGNVSDHSDDFVVTVDTTPPEMPVITGFSTDGGVTLSPPGGAVNNREFTIHGTAEPGATVTLTGVSGMFTAASDGKWVASKELLLGDSFTTKATATDAAGNAGAASADATVTLDEGADTPTIYGFTDPAGLDIGPVTEVATLKVYGFAEANSEVTLFLEMNGAVGITAGTTTADAFGEWTFDYTGTVLPDGVHPWTAQIEDPAGNTSGLSDPPSVITVDAHGPVGSVLINGGSSTVFTHTVTLTLTATDAGSGVADMRLSQDGVAWSDWEAYAASKSFTFAGGLGYKTVYVQYRDGSGKISDTYQATVNVVQPNSSTPSPEPSPSPEPANTRLAIVTTGASAVQVEIVRTSVNGKPMDTVNLNAQKAAEIVNQALSTSRKTARILIDDLPNEPASEIRVNIPGASLQAMGAAGMTFEMQIGDILITLPAATLQALQAAGNDTFFRVVPIREANEKQAVVERTLQAEEIREAAGDGKATVIGTPATIETNYKDYATRIEFPLDALPDNPAARQAFVDSLSVYIEHSDGEKVLQKGEIVYDAGGNPVGIAIEVRKFSTFVIVSIPAPPPSFPAYIGGYPDGSFRPDFVVTRAEFAAMLARLLPDSGGEVSAGAPFADVAAGHWANEAIAKVSRAGWMEGSPDGTFRPGAVVTRAEAAAVLQAIKRLEVGEADPGFPDVGVHWAASAIAAVRKAGLIEGYADGTFRPDRALTRAESVALLNRTFDREPLAGTVVESVWSDVPVGHWAAADIAEASRSYD